MKKIYFIFFGLSLLTACDLDVPIPENEITADDAIESEADLQAVLNSAYDVVANYNGGQIQRIADLLGDDIDERFTDGNGFLKEVYNRNTNFFNSDVGALYQQPYFAIFRANTVLENLDKISLSDETRLQFESEAKFIRGLGHFDLVRLFAQPSGYTEDDSHLGIALRLNTSYEPSPRSTVQECYDQIIQDFSFAEENLPASNGNYVNQYVAKGYLAKVYFQRNDFVNAALKASEVIESPNNYSLQSSVNARFSQTITKESIFTIISTANSDNRAKTFMDSYRNDVNEPFLKISESQYDAATINGPTDDRSVWFDVYISSSGTEYYVVNKYNQTYMNISLLHLADMLLIRAESLAELDQDLSTAIDDINAIRTRAGLFERSAASTREQVIEYAREERRIEMAIEGDRIHQLKRRGAKGETITVRGADWDCPGSVLQFPANEGSPGFVFNEQGQCN